MTAQMLVPLIAVMLVFVFIGRIAGKEQAKMQSATRVAVIDMDRSQWSREVPGILTSNNFDVKEYTAQSEEDAVGMVRQNQEKLAVIIPQGFGAGMDAGEPREVKVYTVLRSISLAGTRGGQQLQGALAAVNETISSQLLSKRLPAGNIAQLKNPVQTASFVMVNDKQAKVTPAALAGLISSQTTFVPIILFLVIIFASQLIAVSIATEKENKTLETLLSTPVSRNAIVLSKLVGAGSVALVTSVIYLLGMRYYMTGLTGGALGGGDAATRAAAMQLGLVMSAGDYILLGVSLFFGILTALSIALILGSFAEDAKSAQGVVAPLMVLILIPYFLTILLDVSTLTPAMQKAVYAIPFSHPFLASPNLLLKNYEPVLLGIVYMAACFAVFVAVASRIFASDRILTMRLNLRKKRRE